VRGLKRLERDVSLGVLVTSQNYNSACVDGCRDHLASANKSSDVRVGYPQHASRDASSRYRLAWPTITTAFTSLRRSGPNVRQAIASDPVSLEDVR
jgi:hypothetical protein